jgi:hypothetical protein
MSGYCVFACDCTLVLNVILLSDFFCEDDKVKLYELQHEHPNEERITEIMAATCESRRQWIQTKNPPLSSIMKKFPPLTALYSKHVSFTSMGHIGVLCVTIKLKSTVFSLINV